MLAATWYNSWSEEYKGNLFCSKTMDLNGPCHKFQVQRQKSKTDVDSLLENKELFNTSLTRHRVTPQVLEVDENG
jgi:hypothetical protein